MNNQKFTTEMQNKVQEAYGEGCAVCEQQKANQMHKQQLPEEYQSWDRVKDRIYPFVLPKQTYREFTETFVSRTYRDLLVFYMLRISADDKGSIKLTKEMAACWGIREEDLYRQAVRNMCTDGYQIKDMEQVLDELILGEETETAAPPKTAALYVLTNKSKYLGAAGILLAASLMKPCIGRTNFYVLPSSIHELILVPDRGEYCAKELNNIVQAVNKEKLLPEEVLADHIYYFDWKKRTLYAIYSPKEG